MRILRKIMMLLSLTLIATAFTTGSASAQEEPVEVFEEVGQTHTDPCNPCNVHIEGEASFSRPDGVMVTRCHDEFFADIYHDGTGEIEWTGNSEGAPGCIIQNCAPPLNHRSLYDMGELVTGGEHVRLDFCFNNLQCNGHELDISHLGAHIYEFSFHEQCPHPILPFIEVEGHWETEHDLGIDDEIEIEHDEA